MAEVSDSPQYLVIDASVLLCRFLPDEKPPENISVLFKKYEAGSIKFIVPELLKYEIANSLKSGVLQKRLSLETAQNILASILLLTINYLDADFQVCLNLAVKYNISVYDAAYEALARKHKTRLITLDDNLAAIA